MAISITNKANVFSGTNLSSYITGSWTPTTGRLAICSVEAEISGTAVAPTTVIGNGLTWTKITDYNCDTSGTTVNISIWAAFTTGGSAGAVTADFGGVSQAGCNVIVDEVTGAYVSGTITQAFIQNKNGSVNASGLNESISLTSAITSGNASFGVFNHQADETTTVGSGYTQLGVGSHAGPASALMTEYKAAGAQVVDASWTTSSGKGGIAVEIKAASAGTTYTQSISGGITPAGTLSRQSNKVVSGAISSIAGAIAKQSYKTFTGAISSIVGTLSKQDNKTLSGASISSGSLTRRVNKTLSGALSTITGTLNSIRLSIVSLSGNVTPSGTISKQSNKVFVGVSTSAGTISKQSNKSLSGTVSSITSTFASLRLFAVSLIGSITVAGELSKQSNKSLAGTSDLSGDVSKIISKFLSGAISSITGTLSKIFSGIGISEAYATYIIAAENRIYIIPAIEIETIVSRTITIDSENRTVEVLHD